MYFFYTVFNNGFCLFKFKNKYFFFKSYTQPMKTHRIQGRTKNAYSDITFYRI